MSAFEILLISRFAIDETRGVEIAKSTLKNRASENAKY
jgi:hypothetical protein